MAKQIKVRAVQKLSRFSDYRGGMSRKQRAQQRVKNLVAQGYRLNPERASDTYLKAVRTMGQPTERKLATEQLRQNQYVRAKKQRKW